MKTKAYNYQIENHLYADESKIAGKGLFTSKDIKKGEVAFIMKGPKIKFLPKNREESMATPNIVGLDEGLYIEPISPYVFINHNCEPNLAVEDDGVSYVALRDIRAGEELSFDYSISEYSDWDMPCSCGSKSCRKIIRSVDKLPIDFFDKYFPFIPKYFQKVFFKNYIKNHK